MIEWVKINLSDKDLSSLNKAENDEKRSKFLKRIICIRLKNDGLKHEEVGKILRISNNCVTEWIKLYRNKGLKGLLESNYKGKPPKLSSKDNAIIKNYSTKNPFECVKEAREYINKEFGIYFGLTNVWKILKKNGIYLVRKQS